MMRIRRRTVVIKTVMVVMMMVFVGGAHVRLSLSTTYYKNCFNFNSFVNLYWYFTRYVLSSTVISICIYCDIGIGMKVCRWWYFSGAGNCYPVKVRRSYQDCFPLGGEGEPAIHWWCPQILPTCLNHAKWWYIMCPEVHCHSLGVP